MCVEVRAAGAVARCPDTLGRRPEPCVDNDMPLFVRSQTPASSRPMPSVLGVRVPLGDEQDTSPRSWPAARMEAERTRRIGPSTGRIDGESGLRTSIPSSRKSRSIASVTSRVLAMDQARSARRRSRGCRTGGTPAPSSGADVSRRPGPSGVPGSWPNSRASTCVSGRASAKPWCRPSGPRPGVDDDRSDHGASGSRPRGARPRSASAQRLAPGPGRAQKPAFPVLREVHFDQSIDHPPLAVADGGHVDLPVAVGDPELDARGR